MADYGLASGGEELRIYWVADDHSAITTNGTTPIAGTGDETGVALLSITTGLITPTFNVDSYTLEIVKNDDTLLAFTKAHRPAFSANEVDGETVYAEAGTKWDVDADASSGTQMLLVYKGALSGETGKRFALVALGTLENVSENYTTAYKQWSRRTLTFTPIQAKQALVVPASVFAQTGYTAPTLTIASGAIWEQDFLAV